MALRKTLTGHKETQDVVAACSWCVKQLKASNIFIVGSSAGAPIGGEESVARVSSI